MPQRPITGRPQFGERRWLYDQFILLVSYINDTDWYCVRDLYGNIADTDPPQHKLLSWRSLPDKSR